MDGFFQQSEEGPRRTVAFLSLHQVECYGTYADAAKVLKVDLIRSPQHIDAHWRDLSFEDYPEVGHS